MQLETWFDGESTEALAWHLATCSSCFRYVDKLSRVRAAVRQGMAATPGTTAEGAALGGTGAGGTGADLRSRLPQVPSHHPSRRALTLAAVPVVLLLAAGLVVGVDRGAVRGTLSALSGGGASTTSAGGRAAADGGSATRGTDATNGTTASAPSGTTGSTDAGRSGTGGTNGTKSAGSIVGLRLAVVVPTQGPGASDGSAITQAAEKAVAEANASGGVNGGSVQLTVVPAENSAAVAGLAGHVDALVGGFGAVMPLDVQWILPADPWAAGADVVSTELSPEAAGARLGQDLLQRGATGTVGVVEGAGPDAALASGLASAVPVSVVQAPTSDTCLPELAALQAQGVAAVAVAGPPSLAAACVSAVNAGPWSPPGGILLAPSAAYAGISSAGVGAGPGTFTVLGLPWPASPSVGAARFRADLPGLSSYRALVSYAAVELAVDVARTTGSLSTASMTGHTWRNDLYDYSGTANAGAAVVEESAGGWVNAP
jgi:hypothetical protein